MENASKALVIAGAILLAMLTFAMLMLAYSNVQTLKNSELDRTYQEQLTTFNMGFEAYNKRIMYGTDVISVINKAVDNNKSIRLTNGNEVDKLARGYVNVVVNVNKSFETTAEKRYYDADEKLKIDDVSVDSVRVLFPTYGITVETVEVGVSKLGEWANGEVLRENDEFIDFFNSAANDYGPLSRIEDGIPVDYYVYNALTNFKRTIFTCSEVRYDERTGKLKELTFTQVDEL